MYERIAMRSRKPGGADKQYGQAANTEATFTTLDLHGSAGLDVAGVPTVLKGTLGWRPAYCDVTPVSTFVFTGSDPSTMASLPIARDVATAEAGLDLVLTRNAGFGAATPASSSSARDNGAMGEFMAKF